MLRKYRKQIRQNCISLKFPFDMYSNVYGSVVICACMFSDSASYDVREIARKWKNAKRTNKITWGLSDEKFIDKTLEFFGLKRPESFPIAFVQSDLNCLFAPYDDENKCVLPLREDGVYSMTLQNGKVYPINFDFKVD